MGKKQSNTLKEILLAIGNGLFALVKGLFRLLFKIIISFGLYLPGLYALFGYILHVTTGFDPFDFKVYSVIYLSGGVACVICAIIISVRNTIVMPAKSIFGKKTENKEQIKEEWADVDFASEEQQKKSEAEKKELELAPPVNPETKETESDEDLNELDELLPRFLIDDTELQNEITEKEQASNLLFDWLPEKIETTTTEKTVMKKTPKKEIPEIYYSKLQPNILVHEYSDRFELFKTVGEKTVSIGVEYK